nr:antibiotic biosynthesis monooxygenase [Curtobacterium pusillum]
MLSSDAANRPTPRHESRNPMTTRRTLTARFTALPGREAEVRSLVEALERDVNNDAETLTFRVFQDANSRGFTVWEQYDSEAGFQTHVHAAHVVRFNELLTPLIEEDASILTFMTPITTEN